MPNNAMTVDYTRAGKSIIVEFTVEKVIADWSVVHVQGDKTIQSWEGRTDDNLADVAPVDPRAISTTSSLGWTVLLFGPNKAVKVQVLVEARQDGALLGTSKLEVDLEAAKASIVSGTVHLKEAA